MTENSKGRWYIGRVLGNRAARITVLLIALAFVGGFALLQNMGLIEPGTTVAVIGVILFAIVAFPVAMIVGNAANRKINPNE